MGKYRAAHSNALAIDQSSDAKNKHRQAERNGNEGALGSAGKLFFAHDNFPCRKVNLHALTLFPARSGCVKLGGSNLIMHVAGGSAANVNRSLPAVCTSAPTEASTNIYVPTSPPDQWLLSVMRTLLALPPPPERIVQ
ncbi:MULTISPECIES: hypothetical protein [unclassified Bradyrhizobium]|uniref:hypothetical protein n=1 Tax=unclassified Bradyrhizobium TaxID=2631580 RepID=UPI003392AE55